MAAVKILPRRGIAGEKVNPQDAAKNITTKRIPKTPVQIEQIKTSLKGIFLFEGLDTKETDQIIEYMFQKDVKANDIIIKENDPGDNFYVIGSGSYGAYKSDKFLRKYENTGYFGELALLYNTSRHATIKATSNGQLWGLDRDSFQRTVLQHAFEKRSRSEILMRKIPLIKTLPDQDIMKLIDSLKCETSENKTLITEGVKNDFVYFIENGEVQIWKSIDGKNVLKKTLKQNDYFGEETVFFNRPSSFTAKVVVKTNMGVVRGNTFINAIISILPKCKSQCESFLKSIN